MIEIQDPYLSRGGNLPGTYAVDRLYQLSDFYRNNLY